MCTEEKLLIRIAAKIKRIGTAERLKEELRQPPNTFDDECWMWSGAKSGLRRAKAVLRVPESGKQKDVVRCIYELWYGASLDGAVQVRKLPMALCRRSPCVNPTHHHLVPTFNRKLERFAEPPQMPYSWMMRDHDEIEDLMLAIAEKEVDPSWTISRIREEVNPDFSESEFEEALRRMGVVLGG